MLSSAPDRSINRTTALIAFTLGSVFFGYAFIQRVAPSIMTAELMRDFNVGGIALGSLSAFYFWTYASIQLPVGMLTDRFGPRKLMSITASICAVAAVGFALSDSLFFASFWRAIIGGSVAFAFVGTLAISSNWFRHSEQATLVGILQGVGMCGAIFAQAPLRFIVENYGWRNTMLGLAIIVLILAGLLFTRIPHRSTAQKTGKDGTSMIHSSIFQGLGHIAANRQSWICAIFGFGMASTMLSFAGLWAVPWLNTVHHYSPTQSAAITSTLFAGWAVASPIVGWGSDYLGKRNTLMRWGAMIYILAFSIIVFATPQNTALLIALLFISGATGSTMAICFVSIKELNAPQYNSTALGLVNMFVVGSGAIMQPLIGWLLDLNWSGEMVDGARVYSENAYTISFSSLLFVMFMALISTCLMKETHCKQVAS